MAKKKSKPKVKLLGQDGNAFFVIGAVSKALRNAGRTPEEVKKVQERMMSGDYDHLLQVATEVCDVS